MRRDAKALAKACIDINATGGAYRLLSFAVLSAILGLAMAAATASAAAPLISNTNVTSVAYKSAVLSAMVNPEEETTTYHFEYGLADCTANPCASVPQPNGNVGSGAIGVGLSRGITDLQPGTTYHYRVVAINGSGTSEGPDRTFTTYTPASVATCANQKFRTGPGNHLPNCRAYEMVSPVDKNGGDIAPSKSLRVGGPGAAVYQSAAAGNKVVYSAQRAFADAISAPWGSQYMATRTANGWSTHSLNAPRGGKLLIQEGYFDQEYQAFSSDLGTGWLYHDAEPQLAPTAPTGFVNIYRHDTESTQFDPLVTAPPSPGEETTYPPEFGGASSDGMVAAFSSAHSLTPDAPLTEVSEAFQWRAYEWRNGILRLAAILPNGEPYDGYSYIGTMGPRGVRSSSLQNAVSDDGSHVFWTAATFINGTGRVFARVDGSETVPVSEVIGSSPAFFWSASSDGSRALLTSNSSDLYEVQVDAETPRLLAGESLGVAGSSESEDYIYFVSREVLADGASVGNPNLYLDHNGTKTFIAKLAEADVSQAGGRFPSDVSPHPSARTTRVTPDGRSIAFMSTSKQLGEETAGHDNTDAINGKPDSQIYVWSADTQKLTCASCNPSGSRPVGGPFRESWIATAPKNIQVAAYIPGWEWPFYATRALTNDGKRLYYTSYDALVPQDTNGALDVYQWEAKGSGGCQRDSGCIDLISTGESPTSSEFVDASTDGNDAFFLTSSSIDPRDPGLIDLYDARVGGGFEPPSGVAPCEGSTCQSVPAPPNDPTPASAAFNGAGNERAIRHVRKHGKRRHAHKKKRRGQHHAHKRSRGQSSTRKNG